MSAAAGRTGRSPPIAAQIAILLGISLVAAQATALVVVLLSPPPRPSFYRLADVAAALRGGALESRLGRPLVRTVSDEPPAHTADRNPRSPFAEARLEATLAGLLQTPQSRVRFQREGRSWISDVLDGRRPARRRPNGAIPGLPPGEAVPFQGFERAPDSPIGNLVFERQAGAGGGGPSRGGPRLGPGSFGFSPGGELVGEFSAALQGADGRWTVVKPAAEPFPNDWQQRMMLWLAGCLLLVDPAAWWFANRITAPIHLFAEAAERLGRDPRAPPLNLSGPAEIGKAARAFNDMQVRIKRYVDDRTAMVGAISHDLRTPLARIRFKLEAAQPDKAAILSDVAQMEQMIASVLAFIRDASEPRRRERLELLSLLECVVDDAAMLGGDVLIADGEPLLVDGDPLALQRLFSNLVDNALKYGRETNVAINRDGGQALVQITDKGPGLPEAELEAVFQPFYRSGGARNLDKSQGGVGLGMAVARSIARAHGGDVELRSSSGLTALVTLPLAADTV